MPTVQDIARRNDALRGRIPMIAKPDMLCITQGVASLPADDIAAIMAKVRTFDEFTVDNDPHREHDFGAFEHGGRRVFWKIDDHGGHDGIRLVLTVMWADEY